MNKKEYLGFVIVNFFLMTTIQEFNSTHHFLEVGVNRLRRHGDGFLFSIMHIMKKIVTSSNGGSGGGNMVKQGVTDIVEGIRLVYSVIIFNIFFSSMDLVRKVQ